MDDIETTETAPEAVEPTPEEVSSGGNEIRDPEAVLRSLEAARGDVKRAKADKAKLEQRLQEQTQAQATLQQQLTTLQEQFKAYEGLNLEEVQSWRQTYEQHTAQQRQAEEEALTAKGELETVRKRYADELTATRAEFEKVKAALQEKARQSEETFGTEKTALHQQVSDLQTQLRQLRVENEFSRAFSKHKGLPAYYNLLLREVAEVVDFDESGKSRILTSDRQTERLNDSGDPYTMDMLFAELQSTYGGMFAAANDKTGGGKPATDPTATARKPRQISASQLNNLAALGVTLEDIQTGAVQVVA